MAFSSVCSYPRNIIQFTEVSKLFLLCMLLLLRLSVAAIVWQRKCHWASPIRNGSALEGNLKVVLNSLVENVNKTGYTVSSHGENGDKMYGLAQCRGDLNASACRGCISYAKKNLSEICTSTSGSLNYPTKGCFLRYDTYNFSSKFNSSDASIAAHTWCDAVQLNGTVGNERGLDWWLSPFLNKLMDDAVSSNVGYSTRNDTGVYGLANNVGYSTRNDSDIYGLAQCWRDLNTSMCRQCLKSLYDSLGSCPSGTRQGNAVYINCVIRYARFKFYGDGVPLLSPPSGSVPSIAPSSGPSILLPNRPSKGKGHLKMLGLIIGGALVMVVLIGVVVIWRRKVIKPGYKKHPPGYYKPSSELSIAISKSKLNYKFQTLQTATKNFNPTNKIGQGGFGSVYKGVIPDGREIAVKRLFVNKEESVNEFFNEVNLISCVQHKNLVKLLGCSVDGPDKLLVYEYLPNKSLDNFLFDKNMENMLDWQRRFEIILGTASGLAYLHQESDFRIIHRDIKASNILLDCHFKPKIADFGLVRYFDEDQTHLSTGIVGTRGYMAPEYLVHGHLTEKVDVYAFGVLVLEIISGRRNKTPMHDNDIPSLLTMVWNCHASGTISNVIDPNIQENYQEVLQVVHIALLCTQALATLRPSMSQVIMFLTNKDPNLPDATPPPFIDVIHLQSDINTSVASIHSKSNTSVASNHSHSSSSTMPMSLNTISTSPFGPR